PDLAVAETQIRYPGGFRLPARMTAARLPDGGVVLISPIEIDGDLQREIEALGPVRYLVGPNLHHHLFLRPARERFPAAALVGAPGLPSKRENLPFDHELDGAPPWGGGLVPHLVRGQPRMNEIVFHHRSSGTLVVCDLVFNMVSYEGAATGITLRLMGTPGRLAMSRLVRFLIKDRAAFDESIDQILALDFDRVIMAHGDVVDTGGRAALTRALGRA